MGNIAGKKIFELNREDLDEFIERKMLKNPGLDDGIYLAKFGIFPLGIARVHGETVEINYPTQY